MAQKFKLIDSLGNTTSIDTAVAGDSVAGVTAHLTIYAEDGVTALATLDVTGDTVQQKGEGPIGLPLGTGTTDRMVMNATDDVVLWDASHLDNTTFDVPLDDRARLQNDTQAHAYEQFDMGAGNDVLDLSYFAGTAGYHNSSSANLASPGAYGFAVTAWGNAGNDVLVGGTGNDVLYGDGSSGTVNPTPGSDTLFGGAGNDVLYSDSGVIGGSAAGTVDTLFGGSGQDNIHVGTDSIASSSTDILGWDGYSIAEVTITASAGSNFNTDIIDGGSNDPSQPDGDLGIQDTVTLDMDPNSPLNVFGWTALGSGAVVLANVEAIVATLGADLINLTYSAGGTHLAYDGDIFINANFGNDIVFSGSGADTIVGDNLASTPGATPGDDLLYGGGGADTIYGDFITTLFGGDIGGNDTIFGGFGNDTLYGGAGNDTISDPDSADIYGGLGNDRISAHLDLGFLGDHTIDGGPASGTTDGNDFVFVSGAYNSVHSNLGAGNDTFISGVTTENGESGIGALVDVVFGGAGNDVISTFFGDDTLYGGAGEDALWGGSNDGGGNYLYGGADSDYLYGGDSGNDVMYGGGGSDYYYWAEWQSGGNDQIWDLHRTGDTPDGSSNYLVVFGAFDDADTPEGTQTSPDFLANGFGVFQVSHDLEHPATIDLGGGGSYSDGLQLSDNGNGTWTLESLYTGSNITFDPNDITTIVLWNNDAIDPNDPNADLYGHGAPVMTYYNWNGTTYVYSATPN